MSHHLRIAEHAAEDRADLDRAHRLVSGEAAVIRLAVKIERIPIRFRLIVGPGGLRTERPSPVPDLV